MKKFLSLTLVAFVLLCLASCDLFEGIFEHDDHTYEYIQYETGHFKQYTCGCPSPDIMGEHCDNDENDACDVCGFLLNSSNVAQIVLDYEQSLREEIDKLHAAHPEYNYYYHSVDEVHCTFVLSDNTSANDIVAKYDMENLFAGADE